jgi:hypothetical protein
VSGEQLLASLPAALFAQVSPVPRGVASPRITLAAWSSVVLERLLVGPLRRVAVQPVPGLDPAWTSWQEACRAWLRGLELVRERLLDILVAEGVKPISARGTGFDPQQHVALGTVAATPEIPAGTVVAELRRGYRLGERVLRYAEVTVARAEREEQ